MFKLLIACAFILTSMNVYADLTQDTITAEVVDVRDDNSQQLNEISLENIANRKELLVIKYFDAHKNMLGLSELRNIAQMGNIITLQLGCVFAIIDGKSHITKFKKYDVRTVYIIANNLEFCYVENAYLDPQ